MNLLDWIKPRPQSLGPAPDGLDGIYGRLTKGAKWVGPDPAGDPKRFVSEPRNLTFEIVKWDWQEALSVVAVATWREIPIGVGFVFGIADGTKKDSKETNSLEKGNLTLKSRQEWTIPQGHPTREAALVSIGEPTSNLLTLLEGCFEERPTGRAALPANRAQLCEIIILRGLINPAATLLTARIKVILSHPESDRPYGEFFLNVNSVTKSIWVSEKSGEYREAILRWASA